MTNDENKMTNAGRLMREGGAGAVKLEGGARVVDTVRHMTEAGIPVMGHVGLRPQAVNVDGKFRAKGRTKEERAQVLAEARAADAAGAFAIVVEGVDETLAPEITAAVKAPTVVVAARREEGLEDGRTHLLGDARSVVAKRDVHEPTLGGDLDR